MAGDSIETFLFTSESVNEGHPDKLADQVRRGAFEVQGAQAQAEAAGRSSGQAAGWLLAGRNCSIE